MEFALIVAENITQGYGQQTVLNRLNLSFEPGVTALLGPNGAGKTTLLRTLATTQPPRSGRLSIAGVDIDSERSAKMARRQIGYLPQAFSFEPGMRVQDFVMYGAWVRGVPPREWAASAQLALDYVGLFDMARQRMGRLSGGMRQRAGIAYAVVGGPRVVLLDEPTVGLDPEQRVLFRALISGLTDTVVVLCTHLTDDVDAMCDRVVVMKDGEVVFEGPTAALKVRARDGAVGHTDVERGYMSLLKSGQDCA